MIDAHECDDSSKKNVALKNLVKMKARKNAGFQKIEVRIIIVVRLENQIKKKRIKAHTKHAS